ncbi:MAG: DUF3048 domain-containing protein [Marmoricola sp.]
MTFLPAHTRRVSARWRAAAAAALALVLGLALAACGGSGSGSGNKAADHRPASQPVKGGKTLAALWPLTGLPAGHKTPNHPVLAVKVPNTPESYPQMGLRSADMVTEELVEGGITRLAAFYYQHVPKLVGPVRSMRNSDIGVAQPAHAVLVSSGAAPSTLRRLHRAHVKFRTSGPGYYRDSSAAPYNLMVHLNQLAKSLPKGKVPASYLPWGSAKDFSGKAGAKNVSVRFSQGHTTQWKYAGGHYNYTNGHAPKSRRFRADNVLVLRVREGNAGYLDPVGNPVPVTILKGTGNALVFHGGKVARGTWSKKGAAAPVKLHARHGALRVPAGHTWIELDPVGKNGGAVTWHK